MSRGPSRVFAAAALIAGLVSAGALQAAVIEVIKIGTWSSAPTGEPNPGQLAQGGKFVITATYDTAAIVPGDPTRFDMDPTRWFSAPLTASGSFNLSIPLQGLGIASQTQSHHFPIGVGFAPTAEIQFFDAAGTQFRGFEFESDFLPGTLVFEMYTSDANNAGTIVTNSHAQILSPGLGPTSITSHTSDVRSEDAGPSGGQQNPGVFLSDAVPVIAEAGTPLAYNASTLTVTTDGGTELVTDAVAPIVPGQVRAAPSALDQQPRQADNDLGAARTDGEDFLNYEWTVDGTAMAGDQSGTRLNRVVQDSGNGPAFVNDGTRSVDNVNVAVGIASSGLTKTTDSVVWQLQVTEDMTGLGGSDSVTVTYDNALPEIANASATAQGLDLLFELAFGDADLIVNALISDFEMLDLLIQVDGIDQTGFFAMLIGGGSQLVSNADLVSQFGVGPHNFFVSVMDLAQGTATERFGFEVLQGGPSPVPEPSSLALLGIAAAGLVFSTRRRTAARSRARRGS